MSESFLDTPTYDCRTSRADSAKRLRTTHAVQSKGFNSDRSGRRGLHNQTTLVRAELPAQPCQIGFNSTNLSTAALDSPVHGDSPIRDLESADCPRKPHAQIQHQTCWHGQSRVPNARFSPDQSPNEFCTYGQELCPMPVPPTDGHAVITDTSCRARRCNACY